MIRYTPILRGSLTCILVSYAVFILFHSLFSQILFKKFCHQSTYYWKKKLKITKQLIAFFVVMSSMLGIDNIMRILARFNCVIYFLIKSKLQITNELIKIRNCFWIVAYIWRKSKKTIVNTTYLSRLIKSCFFFWGSKLKVSFNRIRWEQITKAVSF